MLQHRVSKKLLLHSQGYGNTNVETKQRFFTVHTRRGERTIGRAVSQAISDARLFGNADLRRHSHVEDNDKDNDTRVVITDRDLSGLWWIRTSHRVVNHSIET